MPPPPAIPRLAGWWMPASSAGRPTILLLHGGTGSMSNCVRTIQLLNRAPTSTSSPSTIAAMANPTRPTPPKPAMNEDAAAALNYLLDTRHLSASAIIPYGQGLGAVFAANLSNAHPDLPAVIIETPDPEAFERATSDSQFRWLPTRTIIQEHFDLHAALGNSTRPKLLFADGPDAVIPAAIRTNQAFFRTLPDPKMTVTFDDPHSEAAYLESLRRFLDEYVASPINHLTPNGANP